MRLPALHVSLDELTRESVESNEKRGGLTEEDVRRVVRQELLYSLVGRVKPSDVKHLTSSSTRPQPKSRNLNESSSAGPDLERYRRNKETIQTIKENHPEIEIPEDEEDFCIAHAGCYGGVSTVKVMGEIDRLRERRRLVESDYLNGAGGHCGVHRGRVHRRYLPVSGVLINNSSIRYYP